MKVSLRSLLNPNNGYASVGVLARVLQSWMTTDETYREQVRWGSSGVREVLTDHYGCSSCGLLPWTSGRRGYTDHREHRIGLQRTLLAALLADGDLFARWRSEQCVSLDKPVELYGRKADVNEEREFNAFMALDQQKLTYYPNDCHKRARTLVRPLLEVSPQGVALRVSVAYQRDQSSRWDIGRLLREQPVWKPGRESFGEYCQRARAFFLKGTP